MRGILSKLLLFMVLFAVIPNVYASACINSEKVTYQNLAKNITYNYSYNNELDKYEMVFINVPSNFNIKDIESDIVYYYQEGKIVVSNLNAGKSYKFSVYTNDFYCRDETLYSFYITFPYYNEYSNDSMCKGIENFKYCQEFLPITVTHEQFVKKVTEYKEKLENAKKNNDNNTETKGLLEIYLKYYYIILPLIIVGTIIIRHNIIRKEDLF